MGHFNFHKLQRTWIFFLLLSAPVWARQTAIVTSDRAIVYADDQLSAAVGFVRRGKKISVGSIPKNRPEVYPIVVSGKVAYIRVSDVSTEQQNLDSSILVAERFKREAEEEQKTNYSLNYFNFVSQIGLNKDNGGLKDKDPVNWHGLSLKGSTKVNRLWDVEVLMNFMSSAVEKEAFRVFELGFGGGVHVYDRGRFKSKIFAQLMIVPFSSYAVAEDFRVNSFGFGMGGGASVIYKLGRNLGVEAFGGLYYTKLSEFKAPPPYVIIGPTFLGTRLGVGANYQF